MPGSTGAAVARAGELARALGQAYAQPACEAVLHPEDVIASSLQIPALPRARQAAAVRSVLEPMILGDMDDLAIGHGPRAADGSVALAWTPREPLRRAWALLGEHGLRVRALIAPQTLEPVADAPLREPGDPRWQAAAPSWSLATPHGRRPASRAGVRCALDRDRLRDLAGRPEPVCHAVARRSPLIADTDARTSAEGLPQAARGAGSCAPGAPGAGRAARQTGFVVGRRLPAAGAPRPRPCPSPPTASRACPTPTTPSR